MRWVSEAMVSPTPNAPRKRAIFLVMRFVFWRNVSRCRICSMGNRGVASLCAKSLFANGAAGASGWCIVDVE